GGVRDPGGALHGDVNRRRCTNRRIVEVGHRLTTDDEDDAGVLLVGVWVEHRECKRVAFDISTAGEGGHRCDQFCAGVVVPAGSVSQEQQREVEVIGGEPVV